MKPLLQSLAVFAALQTASLPASPFTDRLDQLKKTGTPAEIQKWITDSYADNKNDPEYFIAAANYWWNLSLEINISTKPSEDGDLTVRDQKTGKEVGSISTVGQANPELPKKALALLTEALQRNPYRLDIALGLAYMLREEKRLKECTGVLKDTLKVAAANPGEIRWKKGLPPEEPVDRLIPGLLHGYTSRFYDEGSKESLELCKGLCLDLVAAYPNHPYAYNLLAALSSAANDNQACIQYLLAALKADPADSLVMFNLGNTYQRTGDPASAKRYFQSVLTSDADAGLKADAKKALEGL